MRAWPCLFVIAACSPTLGTNENGNDTAFQEGDDEDGPVIVHDAVTASFPLGTDVPITCTVTDEGSGVVSVNLYYKNETDSSDDYRAQAMLASGDTYTGTIEGADQMSGGMNYYIEAADAEQNITWSPLDGASDPYHFRLYAPE